MDDMSMGDQLPEHTTTIVPAVSTAVSSSSTTVHNVVPTLKRTGKERRKLQEKVGLYRLGSFLGHGNFARVKTAYHEIANTKVAVKIVDIQSLDANNLAKIDREIRILQQLSHPHIVKLYEVIRSDRYWYIVTEYISGGELYEMLIDKGKQSEPDARRIFHQIIAAVAKCHGMGIVHRDIKAENLLLDKYGNIKLIDFGFSNYQLANTLLTTWCGSPPYAAPELLSGQEYDGTKSDVWSLGVILYILVTAGFPFPGNSIDKLKRAVLSELLRIPFWVSVECADLIRKMLTVNPLKRYSVYQVTQHRWFTHGLSESMKILMQTSLKPGQVSKSSSQNFSLTVDRRQGSKNLDPAVLIFMQQHTNWTDEQIVEDVLKQNFEGPVYATYELLNNKLTKYKGANPLEEDAPRRGSRGSIILGKANVEPGETQTTIPAHHLAKLSLFTSQDYDSDDSSASDVAPEESSSPRMQAVVTNQRRFRRNLYDECNEHAPSEQRRHTLCATDRFPLNPLMTAPRIPLDSMFLAIANFARLQHLQQQSNQAISHHPFEGINPNLPSFTNVINQERRASANEALLGLNSYARLLGTVSPIGMTAAEVTPSQTTRPSVEEEGQMYLSRHGSSKRNTLHAGVGISSLNGTPSSSLSSRHYRTPYAKQNGNERRSSWASTTSAGGHCLSPQQHAQLEKIYRQSIGSNQNSSGVDSLIGVQQLQMEFQKLRACTQETLTPGSSGQLQNRSFSMVPSSLLEMKAPTISITDENNRSLPPAAGSFDPLAFLSQTTKTAQTSSILGQQRPATVIGFTSSSSTASTPDSQPTLISGLPSLTFENLSSNAVKYFFIPVTLETAIERLPKFVAVANELIFEVAPGIDTSRSSAHVRFSKQNSSMLFEMFLNRMPQSPNISRAEFSLLSGDPVEYDSLRSRLLAIFNEIC